LANPYLEKNPFDDPAKERQTIPVTVLLDNIRSPFNTGSIFRSCEALGVEKVIPCGITPTPEKNSKVKKAFKNLDIPLEYRDDAVEAVQNFKKEGYFIYAIEKTENSRSLRDTELSFPAVCVLGNEEFGVNPEILEISDAIIHIPLLGRKNSLNVSVAAGIVLFEIQRNF
jgi:tRNA G18 (ribose-2'-O)-methylase SpoU